MTTLNREISLYIDGDKCGGEDAALDVKNSTPVGTKPAFMAGDEFVLNIYFRRRSTSGAASAALELPNGSTIVVAGKLASNLAATTVLFFASDFALSGAGTDDALYHGSLSLNTDNIATAMAALAANATHALIVVDIEVRDASNTSRVTYRIAANLYRQAFTGEAVPAILPAALLTEEVINGEKVLVFRNSDGIEYFRRRPPGAE